MVPVPVALLHYVLHISVALFYLWCCSNNTSQSDGRGRFDHGQLSQPHILELGCVLRVPRVLMISYFHREWVGQERDFSHAHPSCANTPPWTSDSLPALVPLLRKKIISTPGSATVTALDCRSGLSLRCARSTCAALMHPTYCLPYLCLSPGATYLRAEVLREFLQGWIALGWRIWSVGDVILCAH